MLMRRTTNVLRRNNNYHRYLSTNAVLVFLSILCGY